MSVTEAVLIVIVVALIFVVARKSLMAKVAPQPAPAPPTTNTPAAPTPTAPAPNATTPSNTPAATPATEGFKRSEGACGAKFRTYEEMASTCLKENQEYFIAGGESTDDSKKAMDCACDGADGTFAKFDYGSPNADYKDYVTSQAVDNKVIENHLQFVRDRKGLGPTGEMITGRTYSPDSHDSYDPIPWVGLQRPQYVPVANPTTLADVDYNLYKGRKPYCFWS